MALDNSSTILMVSIGVLAHNEMSRIGGTLSSLLAQSVFTNPESSRSLGRVEIVVVPNGCTDDTASVAYAILEDAVGRLQHSSVEYRVIPTELPGKSRAWNTYVHDLAAPEAEILVFLDADIEFGHPDTVLNSIEALKATPTADVVVDTPVKSFEGKLNARIISLFSKKISESERNNELGVPICGQFYCARANILRKIWMPPNLSGEDGFLRALIVTNLCRSAPDHSKVIRAPNAFHFFEALSSPKALFRHEVRMVIGTSLNCYLIWDFLVFGTLKNGAGAGSFIREKLSEDPQWYDSFIDNQIQRRGWWKLPPGMLFHRFKAIKGRNGTDYAKGLLVALGAFPIDVAVFWHANSLMRRRRATGYW